jgi:hypothetical protein
MLEYFNERLKIYASKWEKINAPPWEVLSVRISDER